MVSISGSGTGASQMHETQKRLKTRMELKLKALLLEYQTGYSSYPPFGMVPFANPYPSYPTTRSLPVPVRLDPHAFDPKKTDWAAQYILV